MKLTIDLNNELWNKKEKTKMTNDVINAISTVGFPVVMCGGFGYFLYIIINKLLSQIDKFGESLDKFNDTLIIMDKRIENIEDSLKTER